MKLYEIILKPQSGFGTPLKGDTLFGHFSWQAAYDASILNGGLNKWIECYKEKPFAVFSSLWPKIRDNGNSFYAFKRPDMPLSFFFPRSNKNKREALEELKENKQKKWMKVNEDLSINIASAEYLTSNQLLQKVDMQANYTAKELMRAKGNKAIYLEYIQQHNTINRLTMTTGEGMFAPFTETSLFYYPQTELAAFVLIDEEATSIEKVCTGLANIGRFGFGRNASTGAGQFELGEHREMVLPSSESFNAYYALGPVVPGKNVFSDYFFMPFVRFGKHGDFLAKSKNPFKNPILMADEGAIFITKNQEPVKKPYIGQAILNTSKVKEHTVVHQGYSIYIPFKLEPNNERNK